MELSSGVRDEIPHATHKISLQEGEGEMEGYCINSRGNIYFHTRFFFKMLSKTKLTCLPQNTFNCVFNSTVQKLRESHHRVC